MKRKRANVKKNRSRLTLAVRKLVHYTEDIFEIYLERKSIDFSPGQCVSIFLGGSNTYREYSIASGIDDPGLSFLIKHLDKGLVSEFLQQRKPGDLIKISRPYGLFRPGQQHGRGRFVFVATGTGIAPFLSYLKSFPDNPPDKFLYGARNFREAVGYNFIRTGCNSLLALSRENRRDFHYGRVTDLLHTLPLENDVHYYLCGLDAMIDEVSEWLTERGIASHHIHREIFFFATPPIQQ
jgi:ferredoxin-NADP reductase